jgi:hypothetical protein
MYVDAEISQNSVESVQVVVPLLLEYITATSVVDCGCKHGEWLSVFRQHGAIRLQGFDRLMYQPYVMVDPTTFKVVDLGKPFSIDGHYDLSVCVEVAEHLPEPAAAPLVRALTAAAPVVLFSAAVPGQGGHGHLNEQPHAYWDELFAQRNFIKIDCLRPRIWQDPRVAWWYRQNLFVYANDEGLARSLALGVESRRNRATDLKLVHEEVLHRHEPIARKVLRRLTRSGPSTRAWYS